MDFYQIGALKVFAELGQLIENDERNQTTILDLPDDIRTHWPSFRMPIHYPTKRWLDSDSHVAIWELSKFSQCKVIRPELTTVGYRPDDGCCFESFRGERVLLKESKGKKMAFSAHRSE